MWLKKPANDYVTNCQMWIATSRLYCRVPYQDKPTGSLEIEAPGSKLFLNLSSPAGSPTIASTACIELREFRQEISQKYPNYSKYRSRPNRGSCNKLVIIYGQM